MQRTTPPRSPEAPRAATNQQPPTGQFNGREVAQGQTLQGQAEAHWPKELQHKLDAMVQTADAMLAQRCLSPAESAQLNELILELTGAAGNVEKNDLPEKQISYYHNVSELFSRTLRLIKNCPDNGTAQKLWDGCVNLFTAYQGMKLGINKHAIGFDCYIALNRLKEHMSDLNIEIPPAVEQSFLKRMLADPHSLKVRGQK